MLILVIALVVLGMTTFMFHSLRKGKSLSEENHGQNTVKGTFSCANCSDYSNRCEQECLLDAYINKGTDWYFNDEELDRFKGRRSADYSDDEAEEFREVMNTMKPQEIADWNRCLILRGIEVPDQIKSELLLLLE